VDEDEVGIDPLRDLIIELHLKLGRRGRVVRHDPTVHGCDLDDRERGAKKRCTNVHDGGESGRWNERQSSSWPVQWPRLRTRGDSPCRQGRQTQHRAAGVSHSTACFPVGAIPTASRWALASIMLLVLSNQTTV